MVMVFFLSAELRSSPLCMGPIENQQLAEPLWRLRQGGGGRNRHMTPHDGRRPAQAIDPAGRQAGRPTRRGATCIG